MSFSFPAGFTFGAATAAFQIEGATHEGGRTDSIWDVFARVPGAVLGGDTGEPACDHYHRMPEDVALLAELGFNAYRFSAAWSRVCPDGGPLNPEGVAFYSRLVDELRAREIEPWITLYHWDLPQTLQERGGWASRESALAFADYAEGLYRELGDKIVNWSTLNEPWCSSLLSYAGGEHAPGHTDPAEAAAAVHHLLLGHGLAVQRIRKVAVEQGWELRLGITLNFTPPTPANPDDPRDVEAARRVDGTTARIFLDPLFRGEYPTDVLEDMAASGLGSHTEAGDLELISQRLDFLGVNYYTGNAVAAPKDGGPWGGGHAEDGFTLEGHNGRPVRSCSIGSERIDGVPRRLPRTGMGWEISPGDLTQLLARLEREYTQGLPLIVTENGAAFDDYPDSDGYVNDSRGRGRYFQEHLAAVSEAISAGANVRGYFAWSLLDNYEWAYGYSKRFGIVRVDYETQQRTPKWSARYLGDIARSIPRV